MINENALVNLLELETYDAAAGTWKPWIAAANSIAITRGGKRAGAGTTVEPGTLAATLVNAGDPLASGSLKPNDIVRVRTRDIPNGSFVPGPDVVKTPGYSTGIPAEVTYTNGFEAGFDGWSAGANSSIADTEVAYTGEHGLAVTRSVSTYGVIQAKRTVTGLTVGRDYTFSAWVVNAEDTNFLAIKIGVTGKGYSTPVDYASLNYTQLSYVFTATATSHELLLETTSGGGPGIPANQMNLYWDDISVTRNAYTVVTPPVMEPGPPVWMAGTPTPGVPIFTGRVYDIATVYRFDKDAGGMTTFVTLAASDAVSQHAAVTRFGAVVEGGAGSETWAQRITRLAASATTEVNLPAPDAPIVRYGI